MTLSENTTFTCAFGVFRLERIPPARHQPLRAWDAADELLLNHLHEQKVLKEASRILIVNDHFGALSVSLHQHTVSHWSDSFVAQQACRNNHALNDLEDNTQYLPSTTSPQGPFDLVLLRIPKTTALLEEQLIRLKPLAPRIIAASMVKHLPKSTLQIFTDIAGATTTSLAKKKARLVFAENDKPETPASRWPRTLNIPEYGLQLVNHANVFSRHSLDIGARFLLEQLEQMPQAQTIVDLGCGNGILGIVLQNRQPHSQLNFLDESWMAVDSARINYAKAFPDRDDASFLASHVFSQYQGNAPDLIVCNPPFHQQHVTSDHVAWQMFRQSHQQLSKGGELWVVANRHLGYHVKLKRLFGNFRNIAANRKFVVLAAKKT